MLEHLILPLGNFYGSRPSRVNYLLLYHIVMSYTSESNFVRRVANFHRHQLHLGRYSLKQRMFVAISTFHHYEIKEIKRVSSHSAVTVVEKSRTIDCSLPVTQTENGKPTERSRIVDVPPIVVTHLNKMTGSIASDTLISGEHILVSTMEDNEQLDDSIVYYNTNSVAMTRWNKPTINVAGLMLHSRKSSNWFHWIIESLPQLIIAEQALGKVDTIIVDRSIKGSANHIASLRKVVGNAYDNIQFVDPDTMLTGADAITVMGTQKNPFNIKLGFHTQNSVGYRSDLVLSLREKLRRGVVIDKSFPKRVFLLRDESTRTYNQNEMLVEFESKGFVGVFCERLSLSDQICLFNNAEYIVGPTGAAWTNVLFASSRAKCFIWAPDGLRDYGCFSNLASIVGAYMTYHFYPDDSCHVGELYRKSYLLNVKQVITDFESAYSPLQSKKIHV